MSVGSGPRWPGAFAYFDRELSSWRTSQGSLLEGSETFSPTWPQRVIWDTAFAYELPTWEPPTVESASSSLLPTPSANDHTGGEGATRAARQETGRTGGAMLRDVGHLLPTPVVTDSFGSRRSTARTKEWKSNPGTTLTDALWETQGRKTDTLGNLLPTPQAADALGGRLDRNPDTLSSGKRPSGTKASVTLATALDSAGAGTSPPSDAGSSSSDPHPAQLTIEDA